MNDKIEWVKKHRLLIWAWAFLLGNVALWVVNDWLWYNVISYDNYYMVNMIWNLVFGTYVVVGLIVTAYFIVTDG